MAGHDTHVKVDFVEACWARNIDSVILPANMTNVFQPVDVAFFDQMKKTYHSKVEAHLLHSSSTSLFKGLFWRWHQLAWKETANTSIETRKRKAGAERDREPPNLCTAMLVLQMTVNQAISGSCTVTRMTELAHPPADVQVLGTSCHVRSALHEAALSLGMTESRLKNRFYEHRANSPY
ncbi:MAG: hypothetical protein TREMPRED_003680, partial [Tremellales sp. Tagirdzhanova-0007]